VRPEIFFWSFKVVNANHINPNKYGEDEKTVEQVISIGFDQSENNHDQNARITEPIGDNEIQKINVIGNIDEFPIQVE